MAATPEILIKEGYSARREHRPAAARALFSEAVELSRRSGDQPLLAEALAGLGQIERDLDDPAAALGHYQESVAVCRRLGDPLRLAHTVRHVGDILRKLNQLDLAAPRYEEALSLYQADASASPLDLANTLRGYALLQAESGQTEAARRLWQQAGELYAQVGVQAGVDESARQVVRLTS